MVRYLEHDSTQYNDMTGTLRFDFHSGDELHAFAEECGIDPSRYIPVAVSTFNAEDYAVLDIYAIDKSAPDAPQTFEGIREYLRVNSNELPTVKIETRKTLDDFRKMIKRLDVVLISRSLPQGCKIRIENSLNLRDPE